MANFVQAVAVGVLIAAGACAQPSPEFSHRLHLAQKLECAACHTSVMRSARVEDNNLPQRAVCLGCHAHEQTSTDGVHRGVSKYRYSSAACYSTGVSKVPVAR